MSYTSRMSSKKKEDPLEERARLLLELATLSLLLQGSWVERYSVCSRANCKCHAGERHGPRHYLVVNENGQQRQKYVPNSQVEAAMEGLEQYRRLREITGRITRLNLALMKDRARGPGLGA